MSKGWGDSGADNICPQVQPTSGFFLQQDISLFDAPFFSISAKEAMGMDPMQRQLLEVAYECFENGELRSCLQYVVHPTNRSVSWRASRETLRQLDVRLHRRHDQRLRAHQPIRHIQSASKCSIWDESGNAVKSVVLVLQPCWTKSDSRYRLFFKSVRIALGMPIDQTARISTGTNVIILQTTNGYVLTR